MSRTTGYYLPPEASRKLETLVDSIEARGVFSIDLSALREANDQILDVRPVVKSLPEGLSEEDFVGILELAMLTECATESYAAVFYEGGATYEAPWLSRFIRKVWVPDELTHTDPFRSMLRSLGFSEEELDRQIREVQAKEYVHRNGKTPVELTTYGVLQEYLTDNWHGLVAKLLKEHAPAASYMAMRVKRRETLHYMWYREMTAIQVEANPELIGMVADATCSFTMPGAALVPQYQNQVLHWMPAMGNDFEHLLRDLALHLSAMAGNMRRTGELLLEIASRRGMTFGPLSPRMLMRALDRLGDSGYGLLGEALLERVDVPFPQHETTGFLALGGVTERVRSALRSFIVSRMDLSPTMGTMTPNS